MIHANKKASCEHYPTDLKCIMNMDIADENLSWLYQWDQIRNSATPLYDLPDLASDLGVGKIFVKDESVRSTLESFKALGAPIALIRLILRRWKNQRLDPIALFKGEQAELLKNFTVVSATDGNHGRALAAAAQATGCACVIVLHANVSQEREAAIAAYGAKIIRITGNYDESVEEAARLAKSNGWDVVSDTSYEGYQDVPRDVMQGYGAIGSEVLQQAQANPDHECPFTHVFLQGGVGGLAAGIMSYMWEFMGANRPRFIVVEPQQADCLLQSAIKGHAAKATGSVDSVMAGLACGEASPLAWKFLDQGVDFFMTVSDQDAIEAMKLLAAGNKRDIPIVSGESGAAGLAGLLVLMKDQSASRLVGLDKASRILVINSEGATAPSVYGELVGETSASVLSRQKEWLAY